MISAVREKFGDLEMSSSMQQSRELTGLPKAKPGTSRTSSLLSPSEIESLRREAKADDLRMQEILAKQAKTQAA